MDVSISKEPLSILFSPTAISKTDVWSIDLVKILELMAQVLEASGHKDMRIAGVAALSSSLIYRMKVDSILKLQKDSMVRQQPTRKARVDVSDIQMPYRHRSTYAVSLEDLLDTLQNLVVSMANPRSKSTKRLLESSLEPDFAEHLHSLEKIISSYQDLVLSKIQNNKGSMKQIVEGLDNADAVRCFFALLFLARDGKVILEQDGADITITST